ncbi:MAG: adenylate/guanylate cyclase domain-containing protein [Treponema sp.]|nr:adenylate/guanylate cyclase domain-containing protein [Spirochaetia bacterium]MDD7533666.1 adenylate/guanylate cyclase domain-containing protein [Treponema sp.]MDY5758894.1 adenylate/guanylate cyclase domain-containing protein [Treponema sp.]MDY5818047.1 adenylate/guanylate cyclase domain-containing protein [Treponema sp.]
MSGKIKFFSRVGKTRIIPIGLKMLLIFICLILLSNFITNFISLQLTQRQIINLNNTIMVSQLKELYTTSSNQYQIYSYSGNREESIDAMCKVARTGFDNANSLALGVTNDGEIEFLTDANELAVFPSFDSNALMLLNQNKEKGIEEGSISFSSPYGDYFGVYKYQDDWGYYIIRAELRSDLEKSNYRIYGIISALIIIFTLLFVAAGYITINREFRSLRSFTDDLIEMQKKKKLDLIDISKAPNDDVTYLAASFNSLSMQVSNLLDTFQKFVSKDIVAKAYAGRDVGLEGKQQDLAMLFSDVKSFTYRTETLGNDIIEVLNVHYNRVIHNVHENSGIVGSIIGDAILAIYGTLDSKRSKAYNAVISAWNITRATAELRQEMQGRREEIEKQRKLTESEESVFQAVMVDVGVGVDGGKVFYGTIGRNDFDDPRQSHMTNTVIGDTVNSASRLEGLTRIYHIPVIVSESIKDEVTAETARYKFIEIDTVQVKGKTKGKKIYFPFDTNEMDEALLEKYQKFEEGLKAYYDGDWKAARKIFKGLELDVTQVFLERMGIKSAPADWSGIWTMTTK